MPIDESLASRIRNVLTRKKNIVEKKMFGCICFLLNGNLLVGNWKDALIARLGPDGGAKALQEFHVRAFDITGKPMKNWVVVEPEGIEDDDQLADWIERAMKFVKTLPKKPAGRSVAKAQKPSDKKIRKRQ